MKTAAFTRRGHLAAVVFLAAAAPAALAACGSAAGGDRAGAPGAAATKKPVRLTVYSQNDLTEILPKLTERRPYLTFDFIPSPSGNGPLMDKAIAMGAAGTPPAFHYANSRFIPGLMEPGFLLDHGPLVRKDGLDLANIAKPVIEDVTWKGKLGQLPADVGYSFVQYNKLIFQRGGQPEPGPLWQDKKWTWESFVSAASALSRTLENGQEQAGYSLRTWEGDYLCIIRTLGGEVVNKERTKFVLAVLFAPSLHKRVRVYGARLA